MCLSPTRRTHAFQHVSKVPLRAWLAYQKGGLGTIQDCQGAAVTLIRGVEVNRMVFWHGSGSSGRYSQVDSWRRNPEHGVWASFRLFRMVVPKRGISLSANEPL
eukprot:6669303-Pyramimonas_sp.AAC.1